MSISSMCSAVLGATIGATTVSTAFGLPFGTNLVTWWIGDFVGVLLVTPLALAAFRDEQSPPLGKLTWLRLLEAVAVLLATVAWHPTHF